MEWLFLIVAVVIVWASISSHLTKKRREARRAALLAKYDDPKLVEMIMRRMFWQGQTQEQLLDSLGRPADIDEKVLKTKTKEIWKYNQTGKNRFGLRITIENGLVVGWDQKD